MSGKSFSIRHWTFLIWSSLCILCDSVTLWWAVCELITADTEYIACCHTAHCGVRVGVLQLV
jgi:hypothetical protein